MEYLIALAYILLGLSGGAGHYLKKRYVDGSTRDSFLEYLKSNPPSTKKAIFTIVTTEIGLSLASGGILSLSNVVGAITAGYAVDSGLNRSSDQQKAIDVE